MKPINLNEMEAMILEELDEVKERYEEFKQNKIKIDEVYNKYLVYLGVRRSILRILRKYEETSDETFERYAVEEEIDRRQEEIDRMIFDI